MARGSSSAVNSRNTGALWALLTTVSTTRSDCVCQAGFYGNLANPDSKCRPKPLGFSCEGECTCASGWTPVYNVSADGARLTMRCILQCELGEYAQIEPSTFVKVLPCSLLRRCHGFALASLGEPCGLALAVLDKRWQSHGQPWASLGLALAGHGKLWLCPCQPWQAVASHGWPWQVFACRLSVRAPVQQRCIPCPFDTYSSSQQTVEMQGKPEEAQCTPCPLGFETFGKGQKSVLACRCRCVLRTRTVAYMC
jgi:hypothetical protein